MDFDETDLLKDDGYQGGELEGNTSDPEFVSAPSFFQDSHGSEAHGSESSKRKSLHTSTDSINDDSKPAIHLDSTQTPRKMVHAKRTLQQENNEDNVLVKTYERSSVTKPVAGREPKSDTRTTVLSDDSAIWTLSNSSPRTTGQLDSTVPEPSFGASLPHGTDQTVPVRNDISQDTALPKQDSVTSVNTSEPNTMMDMQNSPDLEGASGQSRSGRQSLAKSTKPKAYLEAHRIQRVKRTNSIENSKLEKAELLSENFAKLYIRSSRSNKKRSAQKQNEEEVYQKIQKHLGCLSEDELKELFTTQDEDGDNLLMIAIIEGCIPLAKCLIHLVPSPNLLDMRNNLGQTALHLTVITRQYKLARKIILAGGNLLACDFIGNTPLHVACSHNDMDSVISLTKIVTSLECSSEAKRESFQVPQPSEIYNHKGETCAHIAARNGYTDLVKYLVETRFHADVNAPERLCGKTVLHLATELGNLDLVKYLLSLKETDRHALTYSRHSALDLALGRGQSTVAKVLQRGGVKPQHMETEEEDNVDNEDDEEEKNLLTLRDFQFSLNGRKSEAMQELTEYDDICIGGKLVQSFYS